LTVSWWCKFKDHIFLCNWILGSSSRDSFSNQWLRLDHKVVRPKRERDYCWAASTKPLT